MTLLTVAIAVPLNTIFGIACAHLMVRSNIRGKWLIGAVVDMPFAVSPVVIGLALILVYGTGGWFGADLASVGGISAQMAKMIYDHFHEGGR